MNTKIKPLLKKGLSGDEVGKIVIQHLLDESFGNETIFTEAEIDWLVGSLTDRSQAQRYNEYNVLWQGFARTAAFIQLVINEAINELTLIKQTVKDLWLYYEIERRASYTKIVTQKQYSELLEEQNKEKLKAEYSLQFLFFCIANNYVLYEREKIKDLWAQYEKEKEIGKEKDPSRNYGTDLLENINYYYIGEEYYQKFLQIKKPIGFFSYGIEGFGENFPELANIIIEDIKELISLGRLHLSLEEDFFSVEDIDLRFRETLLFGEELYGLDIKYIKTNIFNTYTTPEYRDGKRLAIVQDPPPWRVDDKGYYKDGDSDKDEAVLPLLDLHLGKALVMKESSVIAENLVRRAITLEFNLDRVFGIYEGLKVLSEKIDIKLYELLKMKIEEIENNVSHYNIILKLALPTLKMDYLHTQKYTAEELEVAERDILDNQEKWKQEFPYIELFSELKTIDTDKYKTSEEVKKIKRKIKDCDISKIDVWRLRDIYKDKNEAKIK